MKAVSDFAFAAAAVLLIGCAGQSAMAAPAAIDRDAARVADAGQIRPVAAENEDDSAACSKSRKRLWIEGEGWVVRKVTTCR